MKGLMKRLTALFAAALLLIPAAVLSEGETAATPAPAAASAGSVLRYGDKGDAVLKMQTRLSELGYDVGTPDGVFGKGTKKAVQAFQHWNGLETDGEAGPKTLEKLYSEDAVRMPTQDPVNVLEGDLPVLVNKDHPLDELFIPADLVPLKDVLNTKLVKIKYKDTKAVREAAEALEKMLEAAKADGVTKWQVSTAYRSWKQQENTLNSKINSYLKQNKGWSRKKARNAALNTVAEPGCSEHQLGLAIDINVPGTSSFAGTKQCKWLHAHCWEYGFIVRYTKEKKAITGIDEEAWHIRYVGVKHALRIRDLGLCLEEYLDGIADGTIDLTEPEAPDPTDEDETEVIITDEIILPDDDAA